LTEPTFQNLLNRANDVSIPAAQKYPLESASKEYLSSILRDLQIQKYADESIKKLEKEQKQKAPQRPILKASGGLSRRHASC
jgi:hypothetical protein